MRSEWLERTAVKSLKVLGGIGNRRRLRAACIPLIAAVAGTSLMAHAANLTWDPTLQPASPAGGTGTWDTTTANWSNGASDVDWTDTSAAGVDTAIFGGTGGTVTLNTNVSALGLQFTASGYTISGTGLLALGAGGIDASALTTGTTAIANNISLAAGQTWNVGAGSALVSSGIISGANALSLSGGGTVTLSGANTYTGGTTVGAVSLNVNSGSALGTGTVTINNGAILDNTSGAAVTNSKNNTITVGGDFTFAGTNDLGLGSGAVTLTGGDRTITVNNNTLSMGAVNSSVGGLTKAGSGNLRINGGTVSGLLNVSGGKLQTSQDFHANGGLTGSGTIEDSATADKWFFVSQSSNTTFSGVIQGGLGKLGLNKGGTGTLTLTGANQIDDAVTVSGGTLVFSGSHNNTTQTDNIGTTANTNGVLVLPAGVNFNSNYPAGGNPWDGTVAIGTNGTSAGSVQNNGATFNVNEQLGVGMSGYGAYTQTAGNTTIGGFLAVGNNVNGGVVNISGGNFTLVTGDTGAITLGFGGVNAGTYGVMNLSGTANVTVNSSANNGIFIGEVNNGILNMTGNAVLTINSGGTPGTGGGVLFTKNAAGVGILNADGGTVVTPFVSKGSGTGTFNFNGGTLKANANAPAFMTGLTNAYVYSGGGTIDDGGYNITIGQSLLAPSGNGVSNTGLTVSGGGFIDTPVITITGGGGTGATAVATIDSSGNLTGITITNPGTGYTSAPTFNILGGGRGNTGSITGTATLVPNTSGGLTKTGSGTTTLAGVNTYTGPTNVTAGTLAVATGGSILNSHVTLTTGTIGGSGTLGNVTVASSASNVITNGSGTASPLTINSLTFAGDAALDLNIDSTSPALNTTNLITSNGAGISTGKITVNVDNLATWAAGTYDLVSYSTLGGVGFSDFVKGAISGLGIRQSATLTDVPGFIALTISGDSPKWTGALNGNWTTAVQSSPKNWQTVSGLQQTDYMDGDVVLFDDSATGTTNVSISDANVSPTSVTFNNSSKAYSISGPFGIAGATPVNINGAGTVTLSSPNTYTGGTNLNNGTLNINSASAIGTGPLTISNGTIDNTSGAPVTLTTANPIINPTANITFGGSNDLNLGTGALALADNTTFTSNGSANLTIGGVVSGNFSVSKTGTGGLAFSGNNTYSGTTMIHQGTLIIADGVTGTLNNGANSDIQISPTPGDSGTLMVTGGVLNDNRMIIGGDSANTGGDNATLIQTGGTINSLAWFTVGSGNTASNSFPAGEYDMSGGTMNLLGRQMEVANFIGTTGTVNMTDGTMNFENNSSLALGANNDAGDGTFTQSGGNVTFYSNTTAVGGTGILYLGKASTLGGTYTYNLNGGTLTVPQIQETAGSGGTGIFNFNGGTLRAAKPNTTFMTGLDQARVLAGGAIIDDNGFAVTIGQALSSGVAGDGGLTKLGNGTLTLTGSSTYNGPTSVQAGKLVIGSSGAINGSSGITINNGGTLVQASSVAMSPTVNVSGGGTLSGSNATVNTVIVAAGGTIANGNGDTGILTIGSLTFDAAGFVNSVLAGPDATANPGISVTDLTTSGGSGSSTGLVTVNASNSLWNSGVYDLLAYSTLSGPGFSDFTLGTVTGLNPRQSASLTDLPGEIALTISGGDSPVWTGLASASWTTATIPSPKNWRLQNSGTATDFLVGDAVIFDDTATGTTNVDISDANVAPTSVTFNNSNLNYTISSSGGFGISSGFLVKNGTGAVTINTDNTYAGGTTLNGGTLNVNTASALGTGNITLNGGTLGNTGGAAVVLAANAPVNIAGDFSFAGPNDLSLGTGTVTLSGAGSSRSINVSGGTLSMGPIPSGVGYGLTITGSGTVSIVASANDNNVARVSHLDGTLEVDSATFNIGGNDFYAGGLAGDGTVQNGSTTTRWLFVNNTADDTFSGSLQDGGSGHLGLSKSGAGSLTLTGSSQLGDELTVHGGAVNINSPSFTVTKTSAPGIAVGGGNATVDGALFLQGGNLQTSSEIWLATADGGYGYMNISGGNATVGSWLALGRGGGQGVLDMSGGSLAVTGANLTIGSFGGSTTDIHGVVTIGGNATANVTNNIFVGENTPAVMTVKDNAAVSAGNVVFSQNSATTSVLNLNGGVLATKAVSMRLAGTSTLNFDGGTLKANGNSTNFISNITNAYVYAGGATIDDGGNSVTIAQPLLAPTGNGVSATGLTVSGSGYIGTPVVEVSGDGTGATAVANVDASGNLTGITITNPGVGYTSASFTLVGGGPTASGSISGTPTFVANAGGGLTKQGTGTVTLTGTNTYTGDTNVNEGTLAVSDPTNLGASTNAININGGTLKILGTTYTQTARTVNWSAVGGGFNIDSAANTFTVNSPLSGGGLTKTGPGALVLAQNYNTTSPTFVNAGSVTFSGSGNTLAAINPGSHVSDLAALGDVVVTAGTSNSPGLVSGPIVARSLSASGAITITPSTGTSVLGGLTLAGSTDAWTGRLNISNNAMVIEDPAASGPVASDTAFATLQNQVAYGMNSSNTGGITATLASNQGLAVVRASDVGATGGPVGTFGGEPIDANSVLVAPAVYGDTNLDGKVNDSDLSILLSNFGHSGTGWSEGNFQGSATVDDADLSLLLSNFGFGTGGSAVISSADLSAIQAVSAVPEPASLALLSAGALIALRRRRRRD